jgi:hypothetical protein
MKQDTKNFTHWMPPGGTFPSEWGMVTGLEWCQHERDRINEKAGCERAELKWVGTRYVAVGRVK